MELISHVSFKTSNWEHACLKLRSRLDQQLDTVIIKTLKNRSDSIFRKTHRLTLNSNFENAY